VSKLILKNDYEKGVVVAVRVAYVAVGERARGVALFRGPKRGSEAQASASTPASFER
jgi:hypothetical protein